jgi:NitT/TauT family transport system substrate-binding protein
MLILGCATPAASSGPVALQGDRSQPKHLSYGVLAPGWGDALHVVATEKGFYAAENLTVDQVYTGQSALVCQQILARAIELGGCSMNDLIQVVVTGGAPLEIVMGMSRTAGNYGLMAKPGITSWVDLKGKSVMVGGPNDNTVYFTKSMARPNGLPDGEYDFQYAGASSARYAALKSGAVDAALITPPFDSMAEREGYKRLDTLIPHYLNPQNYSGGGVVARKDWADGHVDEIGRYARSMWQAINWVYDPANKEELFQLMGPRANIPRDQFEDLYELSMVNQAWSTDGVMSDSGISGVLDSLVELGFIQAPAPPPTRFYDPTFVQLARQAPKS